MVTRTKIRLTEADLYAPVRELLRNNGYDVQAEVHRCDVVGRRGDDLVVVELKQRLSLELLVQACDRQRVTDSVYVAVPGRPNIQARGSWHDRAHLLRRLELGLIAVDMQHDPPVARIVFHPIPFQRQKRSARKRAILHEIGDRSGDFNTGGTTRRKIVTAFRERAIHIAVCLDRLGPMSPRQLRALGTGPKTLSVLRSQFNRDWFERVDCGVYALKPEGRADLAQFPDLVTRFRAELES